MIYYPPPQIANPIVDKALCQVRKLVNAVIKTYGKPAAIHVELPRDFVNSKIQKEAYQKQQKANENANKKAEEQYQAIRQVNPHLNLPLKARHDDKLKYRLWLEQDKKCIYSGNTISQTELWSAAVEIDHILPFSRTCDDSYMNKVVCFKRENQNKLNKTPYEAFHQDKDKYEKICARVKKFYYDSKKKKVNSKGAKFFLTKLDSLDDFVARQLSDTRYISTEVQNYLKKLFGKPTQVIPTRGATTAELRHQWGLNSILGDTGEKNRADHRHHALDAVVIALTDRSRYQQLAKAAKKVEDYERPKITLDEPWPTFRPDVTEKINRIIVAHAPNHKLTGALHRETAYGLQKNDSGGQRTVCRVALNKDFTEKYIEEKVIDEGLKEILLGHLKKHGNEPKTAFAADNLPQRPNQAPIKHVRIIAAEKYNSTNYMEIKDKDCEKVKTVYVLRNNHHIEILESTINPGKYDAKVISTKEAAARARGVNQPKQPIIQKDHGEGWKLVTALHVNDLVAVADKEKANGETVPPAKIYRVQKISTTTQITLRLHTAATLDNKQEELIKFAVPLLKENRLQLLSVNILGKRLNENLDNLD